MKIEKMLGGLVSLGLAAALAVPGALAKAQTAPAPQTAAKEMRMHGGGLQAAVESLNLTDDQKAKVKDIFADSKTKKQAVWSSFIFAFFCSSLSEASLDSGIMAKLNEVLTPEQQTELKSKMEAAKTKAPMNP